MGSIRRFELHRDLDITGISGAGVVADGVQFPNDEILTWADGTRTTLPAGWCRITWRGEHASTVLWPSLDDVIAIHGHGGATRVVWLDGGLMPGMATVVNNTGKPECVLTADQFVDAANPDHVHVRPLNDQIEHSLSEDCPCGPTIEPVPREDGSMGWLVTHHSLDGRENHE